MNRDLAGAIDLIKQIDLGNTLFFFDPLLYTPWSEIEKVSRDRIKSYYQTGTEFVVFLFNSDWFLGRKTLDPPLTPFPTGQHTQWTADEKTTVAKMNDLF
jgi:hypothetical protein